MRTTVDLSEPLLRYARKPASERGVTLSAIVEDTLRGHLSERLLEPSQDFKLVTVKGKQAQPDLDLDTSPPWHSAIFQNLCAE